MTYRERIAAIVPHVPAHVVEAWMRSEYGTLDALSSGLFRAAALRGASCARAADAGLNDALCRSYGVSA